jgi:hypothetical protein
MTRAMMKTDGGDAVMKNEETVTTSLDIYRMVFIARAREKHGKDLARAGGSRVGQARATENFAMASLLQVRKYGSARLEDSKLLGISSSFEELLEDVFFSFAK